MIEGLFAPMHLLVIGSIALFVFGPSRLPELGRGFGQAIRAFKAGLDEIQTAKPTPMLAAEVVTSRERDSGATDPADGVIGQTTSRTSRETSLFHLCS